MERSPGTVLGLLLVPLCCKLWTSKMGLVVLQRGQCEGEEDNVDFSLDVNRGGNS